MLYWASSCPLLHKLNVRAIHPDVFGRLYYQNKALTAWLADKRIVQVFLPPYSLNLMEHLWKFLRQKIINTAFYRTKGQFKTAVLDFFDRLDEFGPELASRMRLKFHVLDSQPNS